MHIAKPLHLRRGALAATLACALGLSPAFAAEDVVSLDRALAEALAANAHLPLPALEVTVAAERAKEARAEKWLKVAVEGDFIYAPPGYSEAITNLGEARLQAVVRQPIYAGGALKAAVERAGAGIEGARARYRMAQKDLELEVRSRFSELAQARVEIEVRRAGLEQLETYQSSLRSRKAAGQGVAADLLKTEVRIELEQAALNEAEQRADEARLSLNDLMGRDPERPLALEPLPDPGAPQESSADAWTNAPEIGAAEAAARVAAADSTIAAAERRPRLMLSADAGFLTDDTTHLNSRFWDHFWHDAGYSFGLVFAWPLWDTGAARARVAQANLGLQQARLQVDVERRDARLAWEKARAARDRLSAQIAILSRAMPDAQDSYLEAESRYRGGTATALEVLDAHAAAVDAAVRRSDAIARYRVAEAALLRWGAP
jgi:outer membrane protein TolC